MAILLTRRSSNTAFGGMWAFPGGRVDPTDQHGEGTEHTLAAARNAAVREAKEEADIDLEAEALIPYAYFEPPVQAPRRYLTWLFVAPDPGGDAGTVVVDDGEITDHAWLTPATVLQRQAQGDIELAPPTYLTLFKLQSYPTTEQLLHFAAATEPFKHITLMRTHQGNRYVLWPGDSAYPDADLITDGARHRIEITQNGWIAMVNY